MQQKGRYSEIDVDNIKVNDFLKFYYGSGKYPYEKIVGMETGGEDMYAQLIFLVVE
jgi:hypothetical protein